MVNLETLQDVGNEAFWNLYDELHACGLLNNEADSGDLAESLARATAKDRRARLTMIANRLAVGY